MTAIRSPTARKRRVAALLGLVILLAVGDALAWLQMQHMLDRRLDRLVQDAARAGWQLQVASGRRGGWPLAASLTVAAPRLHGADGLVPGGVTWTGDRVTASLSLLHPTRVTIRPGGTQMISVGSATVAGSLRFWSAGAALHLPSQPDGADGRVLFGAQALHLALPGAGPDDVLTIAELHGAVRWTAQAGAEAGAQEAGVQARALTLTLQDIGLPHSNSAATGDVISRAVLEASLSGALNVGAGDKDGFPGRLRGWRDSGGRLLLREFGLDWNGARLGASGQALLDGNFQPDGRFSVRIEGADALLDKLTQSGRLTPGAVSAVRAVLDLVASARDNPGAAAGPPRALPPVELPLTLRGGILLLGQIPLVRVPWPVSGQPGTLP